jgi:polar amino acid transport system substrate-binding protein
MHKTVIAVAFAASLPLAAHAASLRVCTVDWPPYTVSDGRQVSGMHTEMVTELFRQLGDTLQIEQIAWERCLKEMETGGYDAAYSASYKADRAQYALYPKTPLQTVSYVIVAVKGTGTGWDAGRDAAKLAQPIAAPRGFSVTDELRKIAGVTVDDGATNDQQDMQKLAAGRVKSVAIEASAAKSLIEKLHLTDKVEVLSPELISGKDYFVVVAKRYGGSEAAAQQLTDALSAKLAGMRADGELERIVAKY